MKEDQERPEAAKDDSQDEGEAKPSKKAPAGDQPADGEVHAYGEPTDSSGGG